MIYDDLGIRGVINASARWTGLGGSIIKPEVREAMVEASTQFVSIPDLQRAAGRRIAELTNNEDAYISVGAAAGVAVASFAASTKGDAIAILRASEQPVTGQEVLIHASHRFPFDRAVPLVGLKLRTFGNVYGTTKLELEAAITENTAAVLYVAGNHVSGALPLPTVVEVCEQRDIPVIVDAAAQIPPKSNLWRFTRDEGATAAIFSGGKELCGPQASGLIVGKTSFIDACRAAGPPSPYLLRGLKTGKEEMCGLVRAVELYMEFDEEAHIAGLEETVATWNSELGKLAGVNTERVFPNIDGQPTPRTRVRLDDHELDSGRLVSQLGAGDPPINVMPDGPQSVLVAPDTLEPGEAEIVLQRMAEILA